MIINSPSKKSYKQNIPTESVEGTIQSEGGPSYGFNIQFDTDLLAGAVSCVEDGVVFQEGELTGCSDLILDGNLFR